MGDSTQVSVIAYPTEQGEVYSIVSPTDVESAQQWVGIERKHYLIDRMGKYATSVGIIIMVLAIMTGWMLLFFVGFSIFSVATQVQIDGYCMQPLPETRKITSTSARVVDRDMSFEVAQSEYDINPHLAKKYGDIDETIDSTTGEKGKSVDMA